MKISKTCIPTAFLLLLFISFCAKAQPQTQAKFRYDHIILFTTDIYLKDSLDRIFTPAQKLTTKHTKQGTIGHYYLFYNTYIELLYLEDSAVAKNNAVKFGSNYLSRWKPDGHATAIGFGLMAKFHSKAAASNNFHKYYSGDSPGSEYYLMSVHNKDSTQPFLYISMPHRGYESINSIQEISQRPQEIQEDLKSYLTHDSGIQSISKITYKYRAELLKSENLKLLSQTGVVTQKSASTSLTLRFDTDQKKRKEFYINETETLILYY